MGNGSQTVLPRRTSSPNVLFFFEARACWTTTRVRTHGSRAPPERIADDYMRSFTAKFVSPIVNGATPACRALATDLVQGRIVTCVTAPATSHVGTRTDYVDSHRCSRRCGGSTPATTKARGDQLGDSSSERRKLLSRSPSAHRDRRALLRAQRA